MDTVTQALLGATVGQAVFGRRLGRKAALWGAVSGIIPDLDTLAAAPFGEFASMEHHRGISHSLFFGPVVGAAIGYAFWRRRQRQENASQERLADWIGLWVLGLVTHPLLDVFTTYGTQLLAPFSDHRFSVNGIGIIDPVYSILLLVAFVSGLVFHKRPDIGKWSSWAALSLTTAYLGLGVYLNHTAEQLARRQLQATGISAAEVRAYPTVLQLWLRRVVVTSEGTIRVGYVSTLSPSTIQWFSAPRQRHALIDRLTSSSRGQLFHWFAQGMVVGHVERSDNGTIVELDDIRYGLPPNAARGFWGVRATFNDDGEQLTPVTRYRRQVRSSMSGALADLWSAAQGYEPCTFRVGVRGDEPPHC